MDFGAEQSWSACSRGEAIWACCQRACHHICVAMFVYAERLALLGINSTCASVCFPLAQVLLRALRDFNLGKLTADDTSIFMGLLNDLFPRTVQLVPAPSTPSSRPRCRQSPRFTWHAAHTSPGQISSIHGTDALQLFQLV